ncbi:hypothetical protein ACTJKC_22160 [Pedobacter sp. 22226]|uniref:hypothetical protein n=1 Tax=Pedobacter sp. 22226 TaxID=3453894 RepID=UPI003F846E4E
MQINRLLGRFLVLSALLSANSCIKKDQEGIDWRELDKAYRMQPQDSIKLDAVAFLKSNISDISFTEPVFYNYNTGQIKKLSLDSFQNPTELNNYIKTERLNTLAYHRYDITSLSTEDIRRTIDDSYKIWKDNPWKLNIPKEIYLNYLLPYKVMNESPVGNWRSYFFNVFKFLLPINKTSDTPMARKDIDSYIEKGIITLAPPNVFSGNKGDFRFSTWPSLQEMLTARSADCHSESLRNAYLYRSLGIPAAVDFTPFYGGGNAGHSSAVFWDSQKQAFTPKAGQGFNPDYKASKIFRLSFLKQKIWQDTILNLVGSPDNFSIEELKNNHWYDVTREHIKTSTVTMPMPGNRLNYAYICTYTYGNWRPVYYGTKNKESAFSFRDLGLDVIYQTAIPEGKGFKLTGSVFLLDSAGVIKMIKKANGAPARSIALSKINYGSEAWIQKNKSYTLRAIDEKGAWRDIQTRTAVKDSVINFSNISLEGLYLLKCNDKSKRLERPFIWVNNTVRWY